MKYTSDLIIKNVDYTDDGYYQCIAKNRFGTLNSKMALLTVLGECSTDKQVSQSCTELSSVAPPKRGLASLVGHTLL